ncbi:MAG: hypothetical protein GY792_15845 [Gammaproteobacteria bacterium]|nr:hypothetical protein [Gammaproteobacteria bacterium]
MTGIAFIIRGFNNSESSAYLAIASSTFGGGNRGYALVTVICGWSIFSDNKKDIISTYLQMDVMVLAWLMFAVPTLLYLKDKNSKVNFLDSIKAFIKEIGASPIFVMMVVLVSWSFPETLKRTFRASGSLLSRIFYLDKSLKSNDKRIVGLPSLIVGFGAFVGRMFRKSHSDACCNGV